MTIELRFLSELDEMAAAVNLQTIYWGDEQGAIIPSHMLLTIARSGGQIIGAFDGEAMVGVLISLIGLEADQSVYIVSKRMVVLPAYRGQGVGSMLKHTQRDYAVKYGLKLVRWTFDPLFSLNAYFNVRKLGCICSVYLTNYYGTDPKSTLVTLGASDRLQADWWVQGLSNLNLTLADYLEHGAVHANHIDLNGKPSHADGLADDAPHYLLQIPTNYAQMIETSPDFARQWRIHTRQLFTNLFARGYRAQDVIREGDNPRMQVFYVLGQ